ncbi:hypothetical protein [Catenulispora rubra]|uniref:hypothetical protein n=1 Tax=Catenulispora rubra TaxID=280293 RepID=UPI0018922A36|nr:hypothetical protein [Catenulispora rubra]
MTKVGNRDALLGYGSTLRRLGRYPETIDAFRRGDADTAGSARRDEFRPRDPALPPRHRALRDGLDAVE